MNDVKIREILAESPVTINELKEGSLYVLFYEPGQFTQPAIRKMYEIFREEKVRVMMVTVGEVPQIFKLEPVA